MSEEVNIQGDFNLNTVQDMFLTLRVPIITLNPYFVTTTTM